jgi:hypothetical protein
VINILSFTFSKLSFLSVHHDFCAKNLEKFKNNVMLVLVKPLQRFEID